MPSSKNPEIASKYWELYQQGFSLQEVGKAFGVTRQAVWDLLRNHGYELRQKKELPFIEYEGRRYSLYRGHYACRQKGKTFFLHRTVWEQHNGSVPKDCFIIHISGDKSDNRIENLECVESLEWSKNRGQKSGLLSCKKIRRLDTGEVYESIKEASQRVGIDSSCISHALKSGGRSAGTKWEYVMV
jgi:hypothetical protein